MQAKILKAQLNDLCIGGMVLDMNRVNLYSGFSKMNVIEVSQHGINIQTEIGQPIILNSPVVNGPGFTYLNSFGNSSKNEIKNRSSFCIISSLRGLI